MNGDIIEHDPIYPNFYIDTKTLQFKTPTRHFMKFALPMRISMYNFTKNTHQYYRPADLYDHYYNPEEINKLNDEDIQSYISYFKKKKFNFEVNIYVNFVKMKQRNIIKCILDNIKNFNYKIISEFNFNYYYRMKEDFDETWNTIFYYHLLLPRRHKCFVNIKNLTCTCFRFKENKKCNHISKIIVYQICSKYNHPFDLVSLIANYL